jgi:heparosan-N-sulfate-glucuronate 5-epimerase
MSLAKRIQYYRRIFSAYFVAGNSHLSFWHDVPSANPNLSAPDVGEYYMRFDEKANYRGDYDGAGIPLLDYHGQIGKQYNPIAIAQWGLGNYNLFRHTQDPARKDKYLKASDWLCDHLERNRAGVWVWQHHFDWEYRDTLKAPWYSGLAQGQGMSLLVRAYHETRQPEYLHAAQKAFTSFLLPVEDGGVIFTDDRGDLWFEEYIVSPPTHILNGFIWAAWGVYDYFLASGDPTAQSLFQQAVRTLLSNLDAYDMGFWSLYEQSGTRLKMVASPFYHQLHIVQLRIMHVLTGEAKFSEFADRWDRYRQSRSKRTRALCYKSAFKLCYY